MDILSILLPIIGGAISSGVLGKLIAKVDMGMVTNLIAGAIGGGGASMLGLGSMIGLGGMAAATGDAGAASGMDMGAILGGLGTGVVGGGVLQIVAGLAKGMMGKKS